MSAYAGQQVRLAFHLTLSSSITAEQGWYVDDLLLTDAGQTFQEQNGQVIIEAEEFEQTITRNNQQWLTQTVTSGYIGPGYVEIGPDIAIQYTDSYTDTSPELQFPVIFATTGTYHVWIRGYAPNAAGDSIHVGLAPAMITPTMQTVDGLTGLLPRQWAWSKQTTNGGLATLVVAEPGLYMLHAWAREDGFKLDQILLTLDGAYQPGDDR